MLRIRAGCELQLEGEAGLGVFRVQMLCYNAQGAQPKSSEQSRMEKELDEMVIGDDGVEGDMERGGGSS